MDQPLIKLNVHHARQSEPLIHALKWKLLFSTLTSEVRKIELSFVLCIFIISQAEIILLVEKEKC